MWNIFALVFVKHGIIMKKFVATEVWFYRRVSRTSLTERMTNEAVLQSARASKELMRIRQRKMRFRGRVIMRKQFERLRVMVKLRVEEGEEDQG